ncbi:bifunctional DNA primase/polymerase [Rhizobium mesoamericanum]|uniref:DNA primase/polymerase bifunctional N-terminal domain-containing protein n=1 Tax=Rhizobium mesoamericanum STM3625 TaxID=1211777 RepID=K0PR23_9HYPH|nr:bifunctional DNA primase/polymerase [Rhizobium mesoamericanum]CCM76253.1 conserved hypothetical protein [Rhizobium mesoamericanum STM3625]
MTVATAQPKTDSPTIADLRRKLIENGYRITAADGKRPLADNWQQTVLTVDEVEDYTRHYRSQTNTGIVCANVIGIDIDAPDHDVCAALVVALSEIIPEAMDAPTRFGNKPKRLHLVRTAEPQPKVQSDAYLVNGIKHQVEFFGERSQFIGYGAHPDTGRDYEWINGNPLDVPVSDLPIVTPEQLHAYRSRVEEILAARGELNKRGSRTPANDNRPAPVVTTIGDGPWADVKARAFGNLDAWVPALGLEGLKRYDAGFKAVASFRPSTGTRKKRERSLSIQPVGIFDHAPQQAYSPIDLVAVCLGLSPAEAVDWLKARVGGGEREDWGSTEAHEKAMRLAATAKTKTAPLPAAANDDEPLEDDQPADLPPMHPVPFTSEAAGGLIGEIADWILATSRRKVPEFAVMAGIAFMSAFYGRRVVGPTDAGVNLYINGIAGPGFGKEAPQQRLSTLLSDTGLSFMQGPGEVTSARAIEKVMRRCPVTLMLWDEMGEVLESVNSSGSGNWAKTIRKAMLEVYSKSTGVWTCKEDANQESVAKPIYAPALTIMGMSTPVTFFGGLSEKNLSDGFVARMLFIAPSDRIRANPKDGGLNAPSKLVDAVAAAGKAFSWPGMDAQGKWRQADFKPSFATVPWADESAEQAWLAIEDWQIDECERDASRDGIIGRAAENTVKLATLRALSRSPANAAVTAEDVSWAWGIVHASIRAVEEGVDHYMSSSTFEELCKAILDYLRTHRSGKMYKSKLLEKKRIAKHDDRAVNSALDRLKATGAITVDGAVVALVPRTGR